MGRPQEFADELIIILMMIKIHYRLTYRSLEGFMDSVMGLMKLSHRLPTFSLVAKRAGKLTPLALTSKKSSVVVVDASGVKVVGEGEWKVKIHEKSSRRKWVRVHVGIDTATGEIVAQKTTDSNVHDGTMLRELLGQVSGELEKVLADGAYDGRDCQEAILERQAKALVPPPKNGRVQNKDPNRDDVIRIIKELGNDGPARSLWGKLTGYSFRSLVETTFSRIKGLFGPRLFSKRFDNQAVENYLRCLTLNKMNALTA